MQYCLLSLLLIIGTSIPRTGWADTLADDARLGQPVTLSVKGEALGDILPLLTKQTGVALRVSELDVADQKATVFIDARPLSDVMSGLTTLFGFEWRFRETKGKRSYYLGRTTADRVARASVLRRAMEALPAEVVRKMELATLSLEDLKKRQSDLRKSGKSDAADECADLVHYYGTTCYAFSRLAKLPASQRRLLYEGQAIHFDTRSTDPAWQLPEDYAGANVAAAHTPSEKWHPDGKHLELSVEPAAGELTLYAKSFDYSNGGGGMGFDGRMAQVELHRFIPNLTLDLPHPPTPDKLDERLTITAADLTPRAVTIHSLGLSDRPGPNSITATVGSGQGYVETRYPNANLLDLLREKLGTQIMSDDYMGSAFGDAEVVKAAAAGTGRAFLDVISGAHFGKSTWGAKDGMVFCRVTDPYTLDQREVPNRLLRQWQKSYHDLKLFTARDLFEMCQLTNDQQRAFDEDRQLVHIGVRSGELVRCPWNLQLILAALTPRDFDKALNGGLDFDSLSQEQQAPILAWITRTKASKGSFYPTIGKTGIQPAVPIGAISPDESMRHPTTVSFTYDSDKRYQYGYMAAADALRKPAMAEALSKHQYTFSYSVPDSAYIAGRTLDEVWAKALKADPRTTKDKISRTTFAKLTVQFGGLEAQEVQANDSPKAPRSADIAATFQETVPYELMGEEVAITKDN